MLQNCSFIIPKTLTGVHILLKLFVFHVYSFSIGQILQIDSLHDEEAAILSSAYKCPGIIILGQNQYCKAKVANEIFGRTIFPDFDSSDENKKYRTVRFMYGENLKINLELNDFSLAEDLEAYNGPWNTIPRRDLGIAEDEASDSACGSAVLSVSLNHQILRYGSVVVVASSNMPFEESLKRSIKDISPIIVYAFQKEELSTKVSVVLPHLPKKMTDMPYFDGSVFMFVYMVNVVTFRCILDH